MSTILLVRHGQASFGHADYDRLSELGRHQARRLGECLAAGGAHPVRLLSGSLRRQRDTAVALAEGAGWTLPVDVDSGWNEFDHLVLMASLGAEDAAGQRDGRVFQQLLDSAVLRWMRDTDECIGVESFAGFTRRVGEALARVRGSLDRGQSAVVVSSAGPISSLVTDGLEGGSAQWLRLNRVAINTAVTKLVVGRRGLSLVSFNEHHHLAAAEVTYR